MEYYVIKRSVGGESIGMAKGVRGGSVMEVKSEVKRMFKQ